MELITRGEENGARKPYWRMVEKEWIPEEFCCGKIRD
jgi:hypothetical protein